MESLSANTIDTNTFEQHYQLHLQHLKLKGLQPKTIDAYSRAIRRIGLRFDHQIDSLTEAIPHDRRKRRPLSILTNAAHHPPTEAGKALCSQSGACGCWTKPLRGGNGALDANPHCSLIPFTEGPFDDEP